MERGTREGRRTNFDGFCLGGINELVERTTSG
jgi:hypothetical protein